VKFSDDNTADDKNYKNKCRKNVIICEDSMVNALDSNGIPSKSNNVVARSFPGATSQDMLDFCKPLANKKPDVLIFHVGTNDLTKNINNTKENVIKLIDTVKEISPNTEIFLSTVCLRQDVPNINPRRLSLNKDFADICIKYGLEMVDNNNIDSSCLAKKKLHLKMEYHNLQKISSNCFILADLVTTRL